MGGKGGGGGVGGGGAGGEQGGRGQGEGRDGGSRGLVNYRLHEPVDGRDSCQHIAPSVVM